MANKNFWEIRFAIKTIENQIIYKKEIVWASDSWDAKVDIKKKYPEAFNMEVCY